MATIDTTKLSSFGAGGRTFGPGIHQTDDPAVIEAAKAHGLLVDGGTDYLAERALREGDTEGDGYECEHCGANFTRVENVLRHRREVHGLSDHTWPNFDLGAHREKEHGDLHFQREHDRAHEDVDMRAAANTPLNLLHVDRGRQVRDTVPVIDNSGSREGQSGYTVEAGRREAEAAAESDPVPTDDDPVPTDDGTGRRRSRRRGTATEPDGGGAPADTDGEGAPVGDVQPPEQTPGVEPGQTQE